MNTPDKCPHCGAKCPESWSSYWACGTLLRTPDQQTPLCKERTDHAATKLELDHAKADAASWQQQAEQRLNDANEWGRRAERAEARAAELEGLRITGTHFFSNFVGVAVNIPLGSTPTIGGTLGQAMPGGGK